ncbi:hypothetical protein PLESTB_001236500 [Pleodorina starrii]|uniref:Uncharacterized protein n=1 Tax=Pleodorina starrii TaxID=330485 RepID=A0A9W6F5S4_9CHLO|nr:hypothetical protein PLESTB_001236500 [Pleodorina starrii]
MEIPGEEAFTNASRVWWTPGLLERIMSFLPPNDIACSIRLINRATAALFREPQYTTIHLSQPCAPHDFARRWGSAGAVQQLTCKQRRQALHHRWSQGHVRSGSGQQQQERPPPSLQVDATLQPRQHQAVVAAAATSSTPDWRAKVQWLEELLDCPHSTEAAAKALIHPDGLDRLRWLRARGYPLRLGDVVDSIVDMAAPPVVSAALLDYLVSEDEGAASNLEPALKLAAYCGHLALLRTWHAAGRLVARPFVLYGMADAAARGGQMPVLTWLSEEVGLSLGGDVFESGQTLFYCAARNGDVPMMAWVVDRSGCVASVQDAVRGGCEAALDWTLSRGGGGGLSVDNLVDVYVDAAMFGDVASLRWLTRRLPLPYGWSSRQRIQASFQRGIPLPALLWLAEVAGTPLDGREVADTVLRSPTCAYLREPKAAYWAHVADQIGYWRAATGSKLVGAEEMAAVLAEGIP